MLDVAGKRLEHVLSLVFHQLGWELDGGDLDQLAHRCLLELLSDALLLACTQLRLDAGAKARDVRVVADLLSKLVVERW